MILTDEELETMARWERGISHPQDRAILLARVLLDQRAITREAGRILDVLVTSLNGILKYGTRMVDENEKPCGVMIEGVPVESKRLEEAWLKAIDVLERVKRES